MRDDLRGARYLARAIAPQPCIRRIAVIRAHDAPMRIGAQLRGGGPILNHGSAAMLGVGLPPPRIVTGGLPLKRRRPPNLDCLWTFRSRCRAQDDPLWCLSRGHQPPQVNEQLSC